MSVHLARVSPSGFAAKLVGTCAITTLVAAAMLPLAVVPGAGRRRYSAAVVKQLARTILWIWGVRLRLHETSPFPRGQVVYISNHSSTIDLFVLVAIGLPNTRFFLSGYLQKLVPLGILARLMGTFFTVPQERQAERRKIFSRACETLRRTGESVYLSPEGGRITTGEIGHFNKGTFHLAASLQVPIVPLYFHIPAEIDPGMGYDAGTGIVDVVVKPAIDTRTWRVEDAAGNAARLREMFRAWHRQAHGVRHDDAPRLGAEPLPAETR
jgi:1-acyl-sn-glycerol-3-phosphate acyltransferase